MTAAAARSDQILRTTSRLLLSLHLAAVQLFVFLLLILQSLELNYLNIINAKQDTNKRERVHGTVESVVGEIFRQRGAANDCGK